MTYSRGISMAHCLTSEANQGHQTSHITREQAETGSEGSYG